MSYYGKAMEGREKETLIQKVNGFELIEVVWTKDYGGGSEIILQCGCRGDIVYTDESTACWSCNDPVPQELQDLRAILELGDTNI